MPTYLDSFFKKINSTKKMTITISPEHGYVILAASGTFLLNVWQMKKIGGKRKELGIAVSQGLLYRWTEHSADFFEKLSTGGGKQGPQITPWGWIFRTMIFYSLKKFTSRSFQ